MAARAQILLVFLADGSRARCKRGFPDQLQSKYNKELPHETDMTYRASFKVNRFWLPQCFWRFCAYAIHAKRRVRMSWIHKCLRGSLSGERVIHTICHGIEFCQIPEGVQGIQRRPLDEGYLIVLQRFSQVCSMSKVVKPPERKAWASVSHRSR